MKSTIRTFYGGRKSLSGEVSAGPFVVRPDHSGMPLRPFIPRPYATPPCHPGTPPTCSIQPLLPGSRSILLSQPLSPALLTPFSTPGRSPGTPHPPHSSGSFIRSFSPKPLLRPHHSPPATPPYPTPSPAWPSWPSPRRRQRHSAPDCRRGESPPWCPPTTCAPRGCRRSSRRSPSPSSCREC